MADSTSASSTAQRHPEIHLLTYVDKDHTVFQEMLQKHPLPSSYSITYHRGSLLDLKPSLRFDAVVSPANSYGVMDGGFDDILSCAFGPADNYYGLTNVVQDKLWEEWKGFAPPGTCTLVPFEFSSYGYKSRVPTQAERPWGCRVMAVCPTMRQPQDARWDREVVYECIWSLLCAVDKWNATCEESKRINSLLMTPLATGVGGVTPERWASQTLLALRHFDESCQKQEEWLRPRLGKVFAVSRELATTYKSDGRNGPNTSLASLWSRVS